MDLVGRIDDVIRERHLLTHPFYAKWQAGTLPREALREYARQYYAFESTFPRLLSAIHARTEDPAARQAILDNLWDEEHGETNHAELWLRFAEGLGVDREDVRGAAWNEGTRGLVSSYRAAAAEAPVAAAVAAIYAYESQVPEVARAKMAGLRDHFGVADPRSLSFFEVHAALDVEHAAAERRIIAELSAGHENEVMTATEAALEAWWSFLDSVDPGMDAAA